MKSECKKIVVAITGASGSVYGVRLVKALSEIGHKVSLVASTAGRQVMLQETGLTPEDISGPHVSLYPPEEISAPIASGSHPVDGMVIVPCSMASLAGIASGRGDGGLIFRAADVALKEGRPLVIVPRETPLNRIHIQNMLRAHDAGAVIMPAMPPFYSNPSSIADLVSHFTGRILHRLGIDNDLSPEWKGGSL